MKRPHFVLRLRSWSTAIAVTTMLLGIAATPAGAASEIERVWTFNGGNVAIHAVAGGRFAGVVVTPTQFAECAHQVGEVMWTDISQQPDGSFWGFHQWLFEKTCEANPTLGPTVWRVIQKSGGARGLLVCFSEPGGTQPTIASNGTSADVSRNCEESAPTSALPVVTSGGGSGTGKGEQGAEQISFGTTVLLPGAHACVKRGSLRIRIHDPKYDPLKRVVVRIAKRKVADVRGVQKIQRGIVLRGLPSGAYTLKITATTVLDQKLTGKRKFRSCARHGSKVKLHRHGGRKHH
jgi:hypothetical protein